MMSCEFCEIFKKHYRTPPVAASDHRNPSIKGVTLIFWTQFTSKK